MSGPKLKLEADSVMTWDWIFAHFASLHPFKEELDFNTGVKEAEYGFSFPF